jgi:hypothetical protein
MKSPRHLSEGFAAANFLVVIVFLAACVVGIDLLVRSSTNYQRKSISDEEARRSLALASRRALDTLRKGLEADADSPLDLVWTEMRSTGKDGIAIYTEELSSFINPNFVNKSILEKTPLQRILAAGASPSSLQQYREDHGLSTEKAHYAKLIRDDVPTLVGYYGWANINVADEFALRSVFRYLTGSKERAESFHARIQESRRNLHIISRDEVAWSLGSDNEAVFPIINAEPIMNINFVDSEIISALLNDPDYEIKEPTAKLASILDTRSIRAIRENEIPDMLGISKIHTLCQYIGSRSWFWRITAKKDGASCDLVVARLPSNMSLSTSGFPFRVVETRYYP